MSDAPFGLTAQRLLVICRLFRRLGWAERQWVIRRLTADHAALSREEQTARRAHAHG